MKKYSFGEVFLRDCLISGLSIEADLVLDDQEHGSKLFLVSGTEDKKSFHTTFVVGGRVLYDYIEDYDKLLALGDDYLGEENKKELNAFIADTFGAAE